MPTEYLSHAGRLETYAERYSRENAPNWRIKHQIAGFQYYIAGTREIPSIEWHFRCFTGQRCPVDGVFYESAPLLRSAGKLGLTWTGD